VDEFTEAVEAVTTEVFRRAREKSIFNRYGNVYEIFEWEKKYEKNN